MNSFIKTLSTLLFGATMVFAADTVFQTDRIIFGKPAAANKDIVARLSSSTTQPTLRYQNSGSSWQFSNDGTTFSNIAAFPSGTLLMFGGTTCPTGFLAANGSTFLSSTFPDLATTLGDTYGVHSGTTYHLPNTQGVFIRGAGSQTISSVSYTGTQGTTQGDALQNITGAIPSIGGLGTTSGAFTQGAVVGGVQGVPPVNVFQFTFSAASVVRTSTETRPANIVVLYCIKT